MHSFSKSIVVKTLFVCFSFLPLFINAQVHWQHSGGPTGISVSDLYSDGHTAYHSGQFFLYKTTDGENWSAIYNRYLDFFAFYGDTLVGLLKNYLDTDAPSDSIAVSLDGGQTWNTLPLPGGNQSLHNFVATRLGVFLEAGGTGYIWKLADDGLHWEQFHFQGDYPARLFEQDGELYFLTQTRLIHVISPQEFDPLGINITGLSPLFYDQFYAHGQFMSILKNGELPNEYKFYQSFDQGLTWTVMDTTQFGPWVNYLTHQDKIYQVRNHHDVWVSDNNGQSWAQVSFNTDIASFGALASVNENILTTISSEVLNANPTTGEVKQANNFLADGYTANTVSYPGTLLAACGNGLFQYDLTSQQWTQNLNRYTLGQSNSIYDIAANDLGMIILTRNRTSIDQFEISLDFGLTWTVGNFPWAGGTQLRILRLIVIDDIIYVSTRGKKLFRSADHGQSWNEIAPDGKGVNTWVIKWKGMHVIHTDDKIYTSIDDGATWQPFADFALGTLDRMITANDVLFGFVRTASTDPYQRIYLSYDGINWQFAHDGLINYISYYVNPENADNLTLPTDIFENNGRYYLHMDYWGLFVSSDTGSIWFPLNYSQFSNYDMVDSVLFFGNYGGLRKAIAPTVYGIPVSGTVYLDINDNGMQEGNERNLPRVNVHIIDPVSGYPYYGTQTDEGGHYKLGKNVDTEDTLKCNFKSRYLKEIHPPEYIFTQGGEDYDFGIALEENKTDLSLHCNSTFFKSGSDATIRVAYRNEGSTEPESYLTFYMDPHLEFVSAIPAPTIISGDSIIWQLGSIALFTSDAVKITVHVPDSIAPNTSILSKGRITPSGIEETPKDNEAYFTGKVFASHDPNDKLIMPEKGLTIDEIAAGEEIFYTIRFQNTGNYPADRVRIVDPIDTTIILSSVRIVASSHEISSYRILPTTDRIMEVIFDHITLPDSATDYAGSQGYITFAAQRVKGLPFSVGTKNQAHIFFDNNLPVFTNNKSWYPQPNIIVNTAEPSAKELSLHLDPNPADQSVILSIDDISNLQGEVRILSMDGKKLREYNIAVGRTSALLDISSLSAGIYIVEWHRDTLKRVGRLVVQ